MLLSLLLFSATIYDLTKTGHELCLPKFCKSSSAYRVSDEKKLFFFFFFFLE